MEKEIKDMTALELREAIVDLQMDFQIEAGKFFDKGNKSAGMRSRKNTLKLERMYKEYRKKTV